RDRDFARRSATCGRNAAPTETRMGEMLRLTAADGHALDAYRAEPHGPSTGSIVVVQEIFGLTPHIRRVVDRFAAEGFTAVARARFERARGGVVPDSADIERGRDYMRRLEWPPPLADADAALAPLPSPKAAVGYCWGGTVAHAAAAALELDAAVSYYGGGVA